MTSNDADQFGTLIQKGRASDACVALTTIGSDEELTALTDFIARGNRKLATAFTRWCKHRRARIARLTTPNGVHLVRRKTLQLLTY